MIGGWVDVNRRLCVLRWPNKLIPTLERELAKNQSPTLVKAVETSELVFWHSQHPNSGTTTRKAPPGCPWHLAWHESTLRRVSWLAPCLLGYQTFTVLDRYINSLGTFFLWGWCLHLPSGKNILGFYSYWNIPVTFPGHPVKEIIIANFLYNFFGVTVWIMVYIDLLVLFCHCCFSTNNKVITQMLSFPSWFLNAL